MQIVRFFFLGLIGSILCSFLDAAEPFRIQVKTDNAGSSAADQFTLPLASGANYNFTITWGDGTAAQSITTSTSPTHTYASAGTYIISITENTPTGGFPRIFFNNGGDRRKLMQLVQWGDVHWTSFNAAFNGCSNLVITATDEATARTGSVTDFSFAWALCTGLTSFPLINTAAGTDFARAWSSCSGLISFPLINTVAGTDFGGAWAGCSGLTSFPLINTVAGTHFGDAWNSCSGLTSFPLINTVAGTFFAAAWSGCNGLISFPLINTAAGTDFTYAWRDCSGLTSFPLLDTAQGTNFHYAWSGCSGLSSFPLIDTAAGTVFSFTWLGCNNLMTFPVLDLANMADGSDCFSGVTLPTATYTAILTDLAARNLNNHVSFDGGNSRYSTTAVTSRATLTGTRTWTITDGGLAAPIITSPLKVSALQGAAFTYTITASNNPTTFDATGIPSPLVRTAAVISGTAPAATGTYPITISATNAGGTGSAILILTTTSPGGSSGSGGGGNGGGGGCGVGALSALLLVLFAVIGFRRQASRDGV